MRIATVASVVSVAMSQSVTTIPLNRAPAPRTTGASLGPVYVEAMVGTPAQTIRLMLDTSTGYVVRYRSVFSLGFGFRWLPLLFIYANGLTPAARLSGFVRGRRSRSPRPRAGETAPSGPPRDTPRPGPARAPKLPAIRTAVLGRSRPGTRKTTLCQLSALSRTPGAVTCAREIRGPGQDTAGANWIARSRWGQQPCAWTI
eukprot:SAG22_NODE_3797_length_1527_cov_1.230392_1_plen_201_part_00